MLSHDTTPRFRNLSIHSTPRFVSSSFSTNEKDHEERRDPEKECFMCRQANVYMKPIGMLQERRVARRHPPPLTRAQIDELSQKKKLTKREARLLLQCYFPEIKNVKYFQLHKYHSCCYDPKHLNLCKNHITALQHEREKYPDQHFYPHNHDHDHYMSNEGQQHRVSFVRIKIEPTKGIPTRFLGPTALPESLADMLIKQVNRYENKKRPLSFNSDSQNTVQTYKVRRVNEVPYVTDASRLSEHLANLDSDDDDDEDDDNNNDDGGDSSDDEYKIDEYNINTPNSNIRGFQGKVMDRSRLKYERKLQSRQEKDKDKEDISTNVTNGDLVVEDIDEINHLFVNEQGSKLSKPPKPPKPLKKKKRKKRNKKHSQTHHHPKLNHWEQMALDQSKQEVCGCRHHVKRLEADQIIYDWCRCKDHLHKDVKQRRKSIPPPAPPPPPPPPSAPTPPKKIKKVTPSPKIEKKTIGINATEKTTTELALAYDPTTVDYDVIQEVLYYRTSSGRLVKPEITNAFSYNDKSSAKGLNQNKSYSKKPGVLPILEIDEKPQPKDTPSNFSKRGSFANGYTLVDTDALSIKNGIGGIVPSYEVRNSFSTTTGVGGMLGNNVDDDDDDDDDQDDDDDDDQDETVDFTPPKYLPDMPIISPAQSPSLPMSMQKSSKPTYVNQRPTPNFERESSLLANRRWFDQALGDQNLLPVHDGRYGLIAGTSAEEYKLQSQFPDNEYVDPLPQRKKSGCTIS